ASIFVGYWLDGVIHPDPDNPRRSGHRRKDHQRENAKTELISKHAASSEGHRPITSHFLSQRLAVSSRALPDSRAPAARPCLRRHWPAAVDSASATLSPMSGKHQRSG